MIQTNRNIRIIDSKDRAILRFMYSANRPLSGNQIAKKINISPPAIRPRLEGLMSHGILKKMSVGQPRIFQRDFKTKKAVNIKAASKILWGLNLKKVK